MRGIQAKRSLSKCKPAHTGSPSLEIPIPGSLKCSTPLGMGARAKEAGRTPVGQHVVAPMGIRVQKQLRKDDSFSGTVEKVCEGCEIEIVFIATEVVFKNETMMNIAAAAKQCMYVSVTATMRASSRSSPMLRRKATLST